MQTRTSVAAAVLALSVLSSPAGEKGLWWRVLMKLQQGKKVTMNIVLADSTTMKIHRHGGGAKGGPGPEVSTATA